jgi:hypothetical protein
VSWRSFLLLLLLAGPALAGPAVTAAQRKDIHRYYNEFLTCRNHNPDSDSYPNATTSKADNRRFKKACDFRNKLVTKLEKQGFCLYKYYNIGRPDKNGECDALPDH